MGIRETLNNNPAITTGATLAIIVIALGFIIYSSVGSSGPKIPTKAYFTIDDGKTYFPDDINKVPPFKKDGADAVRCHVFSCKDGKDPFVAYLERMTPEAQKQIEAAKAKPEAERDPGFMASIEQSGYEVKKPGDPKWTRMTDYQKFADVTSIRCPDGDNKNLVPVLP